ncbi:hypothetical protein LCGC14_0557830 [marine sediment metagenome]|uniref:Uncharacterized protein n=1 Tax=marine sediment metagenome TaxID=412755 RepID=A0A0F9RMU0_9ZZZZ
MRKASSAAIDLLATMRKRAADDSDTDTKPKKRGVGRRLLSGAGKGALGGAALGAGLPLISGLPQLISPSSGESRKDILKTLLASMLAGGVGGAMLGAPIGATGEALLGRRTA